MKYDFFADTIDLGIDDAEEVYTITLTETGEGGGPPDNFLLLQRSVAGIDDADLVEPYVELNDSSNGRFAGSFVAAELAPTYLHLQISPDATISARPGADGEPVTDLVVRFDADGPTLRRLKFALELVIADGFAFRSIA